MTSVANRIALRTSDEARNTTSKAGRRLGLGLVPILAQPAEDVLDVDDGVVHERADRDRESAERHRVETTSEEREHQDPAHQRQRDRDCGDERGPHVPEEEEEDDQNQDGTVPQRRRHVADRDLDEVGLAEVLLLDDDARGQRALEVGEDAVDLARHREGVGARLLLHAEDHRSLAAVGGRAACRLGSLSHRSHLVESKRDATLDTQHRGREVGRRGRSPEPAHQVLLAARYVEPGGRNGARLLEGTHDVLDRKLGLDHGGRIELHQVLADVAPDRDDLRDAGQREQAAPDGGLGHAAQLHRIDRLRSERDEGDLAHDRADRPERRPLDSCGKRDGLESLGDDLARPVDVLAPLELDPDDGDARPRHRADPPDAGCAVQSGLDREGHEKLDLLGGEALRFGDDGDGGRREVWEDIDRQPSGEEHAGDHEHGGRG